jgi:transposase
MNEQSYDSPMSTRIGRIEVVTRSEKRRRWSDADKQKILRETLEPGATVMAVSKRYGIGTGQIYTWRRLALVGAVTGFVPVTIEAESGADSAAALQPAVPAAFPRPGLIEIELPGGARLRVDEQVNSAALRRVLAALESR